MPTGTPSLRALRTVRQVVALGAVALILALSWLAVDGSAHVRLHSAASAAEPASGKHAYAHDQGGSHACHHDDHESARHGCDQGGDGSGEACDDPGCAVARFAAGATDPFHPPILTGPPSRVAPSVQVPAVDRTPDRTPLAWPAPSCGPPQWA
jgi:hypothetical protein